MGLIRDRIYLIPEGLTDGSSDPASYESTRSDKNHFAVFGFNLTF